MDYVQIGAGVILYREDQVLLQLRTFDAAAYPGFWSTFGGHMEDGELPEMTAIREIEEELGVRLDQSQLTSLGTVNVVRGSTSIKISYFSAALEVELSSLSLGEGSGFGLFPAREIHSLRLTPATRMAIDRHYERQGFGWES